MVKEECKGGFCVIYEFNFCVFFIFLILVLLFIIVSIRDLFYVIFWYINILYCKKKIYEIVFLLFFFIIFVLIMCWKIFIILKKMFFIYFFVFLLNILGLKYLIIYIINDISIWNCIVLCLLKKVFSKFFEIIECIFFIKFYSRG